MLKVCVRLLAPFVAVMFLLATDTPAAEKRFVTFDDLMQIRTPSSVAISPDGTSVVFTLQQWTLLDDPEEEREEKPKLVSHLFRVATDVAQPVREPQQLTRGEHGESSPAFSPDGRFIAFVSKRGPSNDATPQLWLLPVDGGEARRLTDENAGVRAFAFGPDSKRIAYVAAEARSKEDKDRRKLGDDEERYEAEFTMARLWSVDLMSRESALLPVGDHLHVGGAPSWSPDGTKIAFSATPTPMIRDSRAEIYILDLDSEEDGKIEIISTNFGPDRNPRWSPDGRLLAFVSSPNDAEPLPDGTPIQSVGNAHLMIYELSSSTLTDHANPSFDLSAGTPAWEPNSRSLLFTVGAGVDRRIYRYDLENRSYAHLTADGIASVTPANALSASGKHIAYVRESWDSAAEVYVSDTAFASPRRLTAVNAATEDLALGESRVVRWDSTEGFEIEGVLILPVEYEAGTSYPLLVVAHGGPTGAHLNYYRVRYGDGGQHWASNGWAVLYPNPRGSTNYGERFMRANFADWGGGDYRDIMAGVDHLVEAGIADPERLAVQGWSYGGYMTCWAVSQTTRFKAAMMGAGLSNLASMYGTNDIPNYLGAFFNGTLSPETAELYRARSGLTHADHVKTPTLILHGGEDRRVPIGQPMEFFRALKDRGVATELVFYPREGHGLREYHHRLDRLERQYEWITKHTLREVVSPTTN